MPELPHLSPKFRGPRFERHAIPVELLSDLVAYRDLVRDVAKSIYRKSTNRRRVPSAFEQMFRLSLRDVKSGSAVPQLVNDAWETDAYAEIIPFKPFFDEAKGLVDEAVRGSHRGELPKEFPVHLLGCFEKIGRHLEPGEEIDFAPDTNSPAVYDNSVRERLVLMARNQIEADVDLFGKVSGMNHTPSDSFDLLLPDGTTVSGPYQPSHEKALVQVYVDEKSLWLRVKGSGLFDRQKRLMRLSEATEMEVLDQNDVGLLEAVRRINAMTTLGDGWCGLSSRGVSQETAAWAAHVLRTTVDLGELPPPYVFPTPTGEIQLEWKIEALSIDVRLNGSTKKADFFAYSETNPSLDLEILVDLQSPEKISSLADTIANTRRNFS